MSRPTTPSLQTSTSYPLPLNTSASPGRSTTAPVKPKHHIPHHPHRHHHHHHSRDKSIPQSAIQLTTKPFSQILSPIISTAASKSDGPNESRSQHSRSSSAMAQEARVRKEEEEKRRRKVWKSVERKREGRERVDGDLRQTLSVLSTLSTTTTRRLDYTYYALLSHLSALAATISDLRNLSSSTSVHQQTFATESKEISHEISHQISAFEDFEAQSQRIKALQKRMHSGKQYVEALGARLERVKSKVEGYERTEEEWRDRVSRRLRMLWGCIGTILCLFVVFVIIRHWPKARDGVLPPVARFGNLTIGGLVGGDAVLPALDSMALGRKEYRERGNGGTESARGQGGDVNDHPVMRLLDEL